MTKEQIEWLGKNGFIKANPNCDYFLHKRCFDIYIDSTNCVPSFYGDMVGGSFLELKKIKAEIDECIELINEWEHLCKKK